jgi:hypothetical protein
LGNGVFAIRSAKSRTFLGNEISVCKARMNEFGRVSLMVEEFSVIEECQFRAYRPISKSITVTFIRQKSLKAAVNQQWLFVFIVLDQPICI